MKLLALVALAGLAAPGVHAADAAETAQLILEGSNAFRMEQGRAALSVNPALEQAAREFARYMAKTGKYGHAADGREPVQRANAHGYAHCIVAENIAYQYRSSGYEARALAAALVEGWKNSPGHRKNLLDGAVTDTGIGVAQAADGRYYAVQMFGLPKSAAIRFSVRNDAGKVVQYRIGEREYSLAVRAERTHRECRPPALRLPGKATSVGPADGSRYTIGP